MRISTVFLYVMKLFAKVFESPNKKIPSIIEYQSCNLTLEISASPTVLLLITDMFSVGYYSSNSTVFLEYLLHLAVKKPLRRRNLSDGMNTQEILLPPFTKKFQSIVYINIKSSHKIESIGPIHNLRLYIFYNKYSQVTRLTGYVQRQN